MTTKKKQVMVHLPLDYRVGRDEPARGIYRNSVEPPNHTAELIVKITPAAETFPSTEDSDLDLRTQVHIVGSSRALEELGRYLVALARLETADPEPYGSLDHIQDGNGGTLRVLPRRMMMDRGGRSGRKSAEV